jgi:hypothetical protein
MAINATLSYPPLHKQRPLAKLHVFPTFFFYLAVQYVPELCVTDQANDDLRQGQFTYVMDPGMLMIPLLRTVTLTDLTQPH